MQIEIRDDGKVRLFGYVNAVERESRLLPKTMAEEARRPFKEKIRVGTFKRALENNPNVLFKFNHDRVLGGEEDGNLTLDEDAVGLRAEAITDDPEVVEAARQGKLRGWSFGFTKIDDEWVDEGSYDLRTLKEINLSEVSILTMTPAYIATTVETRAMDCEVMDTDTALKIIEILKRRI